MFWEPLLQKNNQSIKIVHKSVVMFILLFLLNDLVHSKLTEYEPTE